MKLNLIAVFLIMLSPLAHSQTGKNTISLLFGGAHTITASTGIYPTSRYGNSPFIVTSGPHIGLSYSHRIYKGISVEGNMIFVDERAQYSYSSETDIHLVNNGHVNMLWLQALCKYTFFKYFFIDAGISADIQTNHTEAMQMYDQSGLGAEAGFGAKLTTGHITFSVNPYWHMHYMLPINIANTKNTWNHELDEEGIRLGVGYNF